MQMFITIRSFCLKEAFKILVGSRRVFSMYSSGVKETMKEKSDKIHVIDVRSDTVTKPTNEMRQAMAAAEVGDDVFGEDPTVNRLQEKAAKLLGKEAGLYVPSGSMGNLISIMVHCPNRGDEILVGDKAHIVKYEQGSSAQFGGVFARQVHTHPDGKLDLDDLKNKISDGSDPHITHSKLICIEQTHNITGGCVLPLSYIDKVHEISKANKLALHMDGARLFNAVAALGVPPSEVVQHMDSVVFCLSKGLGAPVGSMIVGSQDFIQRCHRVRKALGGAMRQAGVIAAAGIYALDHIAPKIIEDHNNAKRLAEGIDQLEGVELNPKVIDTNMVFFEVTSDKVTADEIVQRMGTCQDNEEQYIVKLLTFTATRIRIVLHHQVESSDIDKIVRKLKLALQ